ncbi:MAG: PEP-CTERM sorting domain-containing protein [Verrucomicrobiaceae bacterium]
MKIYRRIPAKTAPNAADYVPTHEHHTGFAKNNAPRKISKLRLYPSRPAKFVAASAALMMVGSAVATTLSVDFLGVTQTNTLSPTDIAGVVPADTWNAATGDNNVGGISVDAPTLPSAALVAWTSSGSANTVPNSLATADHEMMEGFIYGSIGSGGTVPASVRVNSINLVGLGWSSYDLYVYSDTSKNGPTVQIDLFAPGATTYTHTELVSGTYAPPTFSYVDSQTSPAGNYVLYTGLTATDFNIQATPLSGIDLAGINGFQLVGTSVPEPSTGVLALLSATLLVMRRRRS